MLSRNVPQRNRRMTSAESVNFLEGQSKESMLERKPSHHLSNESTMSDSQSPDPPKRSVLILYGSETGNAQEVAEELGVLTERLHFATHVCELNQSKPVRSLLDLYFLPLISVW